MGRVTATGSECRHCVRNVILLSYGLAVGAKFLVSRLRVAVETGRCAGAGDGGRGSGSGSHLYSAGDDLMCGRVQRFELFSTWYQRGARRIKCVVISEFKPDEQVKQLINDNNEKIK